MSTERKCLCGDDRERFDLQHADYCPHAATQAEAPPHGVVDLFAALKTALSTRPKRKRKRGGR